jgi:hypothetical protein
LNRPIGGAGADVAGQFANIPVGGKAGAFLQPAVALAAISARWR